MKGVLTFVEYHVEYGLLCNLSFWVDSNDVTHDWITQQKLISLSYILSSKKIDIPTHNYQGGLQSGD